jgi:hypothetical protein
MSLKTGIQYGKVSVPYAYPFIQLAEKAKPAPLKLIRLGGKLYKIRYTDEDKTRRENYFNNGNGSLTPDETTLLNDIGLTKMEEQLSLNDKKLLPEFFNALPDCQTSTAISLSAKCFMPHHIIKGIIDHAAIESERVYKDFLTKKSPTSDQPGKNGIMLNELMGLVMGASPIGTDVAGPILIDESSMENFFILRV